MKTEKKTNAFKILESVKVGRYSSVNTEEFAVDQSGDRKCMK